MSKVSKEELDIYINDLNSLAHYEENAENDLAEAEKNEVWTPTDYEEKFLPSLRLTGIQNKNNAVFQNVADLHMHTQWSDGDDLDKVLEKAVDERLDVIAVTDHDEIEGALEARRRVHKYRLKLAVVPGVEVSSADGHIGALFVNKKFPKNLSAEETVKLIHEAGGLAVAHHPYAPPFIEKLLNCRLGCKDLIKKVPFDAVECTNAVPGYGSKYNIQTIDEMRKEHIRIAVTGSSDAHYADFVGKGKTYFAGNKGVTSLFENIKLGFTLGSEGYWKFSEKLSYRMMLIKAILNNIFTKHNSVN